MGHPMIYEHQQLANGRWQGLSIFEQMAHIGSEVERTIKWRNKNRVDFAHKAFERALELFDLTMMDPRNKNRLKEIIRARELFSDYIVGDNLYSSSDAQWQKYFYHFNFASRVTKKEKRFIF